MSTIWDLFMEGYRELTGPGYATIRGSLFSGFLSLGGLVLASLTFTTTRVGELMKQPPAQERFRRVLKFNPQASLVSPLRKSAILTKRAAVLCFFTALCQITLGMPASATLRGFCVTMAIVTGVYVAHLAWRSVNVYHAWLDEYDQNIREEAQQRKAS